MIDVASGGWGGVLDAPVRRPEDRGVADSAPATRSPKKADRVAAVRAHRDRMRALESGSIVKDLMKQKGVIRGQEVRDYTLPEGDFRTFVEFYRHEAESWLAKAQRDP